MISNQPFHKVNFNLLKVIRVIIIDFFNLLLCKYSCINVFALAYKKIHFKDLGHYETNGTLGPSSSLQEFLLSFEQKGCSLSTILLLSLENVCVPQKEYPERLPNCTYNLCPQIYFLLHKSILLLTPIPHFSKKNFLVHNTFLSYRSEEGYLCVVEKI